ncbi:hypothetical protein WMY93_024995 [Mugilogobius chulae]|uniref:SOCS box domain-containing protein n=1 Tax=Mugilogobius chulae TaxID=88201 RepID=A0AAW0N145_9GOBI
MEKRGGRGKEEEEVGEKKRRRYERRGGGGGERGGGGGEEKEEVKKWRKWSRRGRGGGEEEESGRKQLEAGRVLDLSDWTDSDSDDCDRSDEYDNIYDDDLSDEEDEEEMEEEEEEEEEEEVQEGPTEPPRSDPLVAAGIAYAREAYERGYELLGFRPPPIIENLRVSEAQLEALGKILQTEPRTHAYFFTVTRALYKVSEQGLRRVAELLVRNGAQMYDPSGLSSDLLNGFGLLRHAISNTDAGMVRMLLNSGFSVTLKPCEQTALLWACEQESTECLQTLLDLGVDVNARDGEGCPLLIALLQESNLSLKILKLLLDRGLDPNAECDDFRTLLEWLFVDIWSWLRSDKDLPKRFHDNVQCLRLLLRHGFRLQRCRPTQQTCLLLVTLQNFTRFFPLAELLLERGEEFTANQSTCVEENRDPSHCCCCYFSVLREALCRSVQHCSEAEVHALLDKANALLDLPIVDPAPLRFTVGKSLEREPEDMRINKVIQPSKSCERGPGAVWAVDAAPAPLQSLCCSYIRRRLLPWPLEPKIQTLPLPQLVKEMLMPLPLDQD